jgi:hypothetical protein
MHLRMKSSWAAKSLSFVLVLGTLGVISAAATDNQPPQIEPIPPQYVEENQPLSFAVEAMDPDGDTLSYSLQDAPAGMTIDPNGMVTWNPGTGASGTYGVTVQVTDNRGALSESDEEVAGVVVSP